MGSFKKGGREGPRDLCWRSTCLLACTYLHSYDLNFLFTAEISGSLGWVSVMQWVVLVVTCHGGGEVVVVAAVMRYHSTPGECSADLHVECVVAGIHLLLDSGEKRCTCS